MGKGSGKSSRHIAHASAAGGAATGARGDRRPWLCPALQRGLQREASASARSAQLWRPGSRRGAESHSWLLRCAREEDQASLISRESVWGWQKPAMRSARSALVWSVTGHDAYWGVSSSLRVLSIAVASPLWLGVWLGAAASKATVARALWRPSPPVTPTAAHVRWWVETVTYTSPVRD